MYIPIKYSQKNPNKLIKYSIHEMKFTKSSAIKKKKDKEVLTWVYLKIRDMFHKCKKLCRNPWVEHSGTRVIDVEFLTRNHEFKWDMAVDLMLNDNQQTNQSTLSSAQSLPSTFSVLKFKKYILHTNTLLL